MKAPRQSLRVTVCRHGVFELEKLALFGPGSGTPGAMPANIALTIASFLRELAETGPLNGNPLARKAQEHAQELRALAAALSAFKGRLGVVVAQELRPRELADGGA